MPVIVRLPELDFFDDKEGKPAAIQKFIGQRPIAAFGNSDGDLQMLQWTAAGPGRRLMVLVDHTDAEREFDYRVSPMGRLEVGTQRGPPARLDGRQHEGRLEADLRLRVSIVRLSSNRLATGLPLETTEGGLPVDGHVLSETRRQRQAHFATILGALVTAGSMVFGVLTYQRSAVESRQAAALGMLQEHLKLAVDHPDLATRGGDRRRMPDTVVCDARVVHGRDAVGARRQRPALAARDRRHFARAQRLPEAGGSGLRRLSTWLRQRTCRPTSRS